MIVNAAELEYAVAELAATAEGLRGEECRERVTAIVRKTGEAMRQFERLVQQERPDPAGSCEIPPACLGRATSFQMWHGARQYLRSMRRLACGRPETVGAEHLDNISNNGFEFPGRA